MQHLLQCIILSKTVLVKPLGKPDYVRIHPAFQKRQNRPGKDDTNARQLSSK